MSQPKNPHENSDAGGKEELRAGEHNESQASFIDRIGASASGLLQSSWNSPAPRAVTNDLGSGQVSTSKGESSNSSTQGGTISAPEAFCMTQSQDSTSHGPVFSESFRSQRLNDRRHAQDEFDQWSMSRADGVLGNVFTGCGIPNTSEWRTAMQGEEKLANACAEDKGDRQYEDVRVGDGTAVVSLLSDPAFNISDQPSSMWDYNPPAQPSQVLQTNQMLLNNGIDPRNLSKGQLDSFRMQNPSVQQKSIEVYTQNMMKHQQRTLNEKGTLGKKQRLENSLGLIPDFGALEPISMRNNLEASQRDDLKARLSNINEGDLKPWLNILDRYQDEVWGNMLPLIQKVREEVRFGNENKTLELQSPRDGPAVRRLKMVLQHLDHSR